MLLFKGKVCTVTGRCNSKNKAALPSFVIRLQSFPHPYPQMWDHFGAFNLSVHSCSRSGYLRNRLRKGDQQAEYYWGVFSGLVPVRGVEEGDLGRGRHWTVCSHNKGVRMVNQAGELCSWDSFAEVSQIGIPNCTKLVQGGQAFICLCWLVTGLWKAGTDLDKMALFRPRLIAVSY